MDEREEYLRQATAVFESMKARERHALTIQAEYGKWLINTLYLLHGGTVVGLLSKAPLRGPSPLYMDSLLWFGAGIIAALFAAFATWWNWTFAIQVYSTMANPKMLVSQDHWPALPNTKKITASMWVAIVFGSVSVGFWIWGAWSVWSRLT